MSEPGFASGRGALGTTTMATIATEAGPTPSPAPSRPFGGWAAVALALAGYLLAMLMLFRGAILSGFDLGFGNRGDALIEISLLEHWRSVLMGAASWNQPLYFHPYADTLGYNDGYLLSGLIYSGWRTVFDPFLADTLTAFTWRSIGYVATLWLVRGVLRWGWGPAILIAILATIANNMFLQAGHAQINSLALLPLLAGLAILAVRSEIARRPHAHLFAVMAAGLIGLWLVTAFYFAWFTFYFTLVFALCWLATTGRLRGSALLALLRAHWRLLATFMGATGIAALAFLAVYLPKRIETGGHGYMVSYLTQPWDVVNVGEYNWLWGWIARAIRAVAEGLSPPGGYLRRAFLGWEHHSGFPLLLFGLICVAGYRLIRWGEDPLVRAFALAVVISWALTLRIWQISPWMLVYYLVPAASGVRVVLRYQLFLALPVLLLVGLAWRDSLARLWQRRPWLASGLVALLIVEQANGWHMTELSRREQSAAFGAIPAPPSGCTSFYVVAARVNEPPFGDADYHAHYAHNVDAMFLAERWRLPTLNGYSTFNPPDWNFAYPLAADYDARVAAYARTHRLTGLCRLDMRAASPWRRL